MDVLFCGSSYFISRTSGREGHGPHATNSLNVNVAASAVAASHDDDDDDDDSNQGDSDNVGVADVHNQHLYLHVPRHLVHHCLSHLCERIQSSLNFSPFTFLRRK